MTLTVAEKSFYQLISDRILEMTAFFIVQMFWHVHLMFSTSIWKRKLNRLYHQVTELDKFFKPIHTGVPFLQCKELHKIGKLINFPFCISVPSKKKGDRTSSQLTLYLRNADISTFVDILHLWNALIIGFSNLSKIFSKKFKKALDLLYIRYIIILVRLIWRTQTF